MHKIAFVIPTKDRPSDLRKMLKSLAQQERKPDQIIVVDGSNPPIKTVVNEFKKLNINYISIYPPSLAKQRNAGMSILNKNISLAGYLDDDVVIEKDAIKNMLSFWNTIESNAGGAVFNITNTPPPKWTRIKSLLFLDSQRPGKLLMSGCTSILGHQNKNIQVDWLCGGATVWKREVIDKYKYDEWFKGTGYLEDVDFSFNVKSEFNLYLVANAKLAHNSAPVKPEKHFVLGKWQIFNRMYIVKKYRHRGLSSKKAWIATIGLIFINLTSGLIRLDKNALNRCLGNIYGALMEFRGCREQLDEQLK